MNISILLQQVYDTIPDLVLTAWQTVEENLKPQGFALRHTSTPRSNNSSHRAVAAQISKSNAYIYREKKLFLFFTTFFWLIRLIHYSEPLIRI